LFGHTQLPATHAALPWHAVPHVLQLALSVWRFVHAPLQTSGDPAGHAQLPPEHVAPVAHAFPQVPQFFGSVF
jgi:hypothetical protein